MLKKIYNFIYNNRAQFLKYTITGSSSFVLDIATLYLITNYLGVHPAVAVALNQVFILCYVFLMNKYWSFQSKGQTQKQVIRFTILMIWNYIFSVTWMWLWVDVFKISFFFPWLEKDIGYLGGRVVSVWVQVSWNFLLYKFWIYKVKKENSN